MVTRMSDAVRADLPRELTLRHVFYAPRALVFQAWTDPVYLAQWWGPEGYTNPVVEVDARPGGTLYIEMRSPDGVTIANHGTFHEVVPPERLVFLTTALPDEHGHPQLEVLNTATFTEDGGRTTVILKTVVLTATAAVSDSLASMEDGWQQSLHRLETTLLPISGYPIS